MAEIFFFKIIAFAVCVTLLQTEQVYGCITSSDCKSPSRRSCCSGVCCSTYTALILGIVGVVFSGGVLIFYCYAGCPRPRCCCRLSRSSTEAVVTPSTAQKVGVTPYPEPQQGYANQTFPMEARPPTVD